MIFEIAGTLLDPAATLARAAEHVGVAPSAWKLAGRGWLFLIELTTVTSRPGQPIEKDLLNVWSTADGYGRAVADAEQWVGIYKPSVTRAVVIGELRFENGSVFPTLTTERAS